MPRIHAKALLPHAVYRKTKQVTTHLSGNSTRIHLELMRGLLWDWINIVRFIEVSRTPAYMSTVYRHDKCWSEEKWLKWLIALTKQCSTHYRTICVPCGQNITLWTNFTIIKSTLCLSCLTHPRLSNRPLLFVTGSEWPYKSTPNPSSQLWPITSDISFSLRS